MKITELYAGDYFVSPAGRLERITEIDVDSLSLLALVHTDKTGGEYGWQMWAHDEVEAVRAASMKPCKVYVVTLSGRSSGIMVYVGADGRYPWGDRAHALASAHHNGPGKGWRVVDRPDGGPLVETNYPSKSAAAVALRTAARAHAKALGLKVEVVKK